MQPPPSMQKKVVAPTVPPPAPFVNFTKALLGGSGSDQDLEACLGADAQSPATWSGAGRLSGLAVAALVKDSNLHLDLQQRLLSAADAKAAGDPVREAAAAIYAYLGLRDFVRAEDLLRADFGILRQHQAGLYGALRPAIDRFGDAHAIGLVMAQVASLSDRNEAAHQFGACLMAEPRLLSALPYFIGAATFGGPTDVAGRTGMKDSRAEAAIRSATQAGRSELTLVLSADAHFLRHYGPNFLNLAPYLDRQGVRIVILVCGDPATTGPVIEEGRQLGQSLATFHGLRSPEAKSRLIRFVAVPTPAWVVEPRTFYACARYLYASDAMAATNAPVLIMDIDMELAMAPDAFLRSAAKLDVAVSFSRGLSPLCPWRRCMAGAAFIRPGDSATAFLGHVEDYLGWGLTRPGSWTLDQNALSYAVDRVGLDAVQVFGTVGRLFKQEKHRVMFERFF